jgi:hypothetical protein
MVGSVHMPNGSASHWKSGIIIVESMLGTFLIMASI